MTLTPEQVKELKDQLREQVKTLPEQQKASALAQIESMSPEALEAMVKQQNSKTKGGAYQKGVFRMVIDKEIPSKIIDENKDCLAVLDIKPISPGHTIIIPKKVVADAKNLPNSCFNLSKKIAKRAELKLKAKGAEIQTEFKFGEVIINIIPVYKESLSLNSPRLDAPDKELEEVQKKLRIIKKPKIEKIKKTTPVQSSIVKLPRRIP